MGERFPTYVAAGLLGAFSLFSDAALADEDWGQSVPNEVNCNYEAWNDEGDVIWLEQTNAAHAYSEKAKLNNFDFIGPASLVPFKASCGEVWVSACLGQPYAEHWLKLKSGQCTSTDTSTKTETHVQTGTASAATPEQAAPIEPPRAACGSPEDEPEEPGITSRMREAKAGIPELEDEFHRHNHKVDEGTGVTKGVADTHGGSPVNDEVAAWAAEKSKTREEISHYYTQIAGGPWTLTSRDSVALVSQKGFSRRITSLYQIYRSHDQAHFHDDAEGVNLSLWHATDEERTHQLALATALETVKAKLSLNVADLDSLKKTEGYRQLAILRARNLEIISCQLASMAEINADRESRMRSLASDPVQGTGPGSGTPSGTNTSALTSTSTEMTVQVGPGGVTVGTVTFTNVETGTTTSTATRSELDDTLAAFGPVDPPKREPQEIGDANSDLFMRTHAKLREREATGTFRTSIVEEDPIRLLP